MMFCPWCVKKNNDNIVSCAFCGNPIEVLNEPHQLIVNTMLNNRYQVGVVLRQGGFGITYVGCDTRLEKKVAIKEYYPSGFANRVSAYSKSVSITAGYKSDLYARELKRFEEEARILAMFSGEKNIVNVTDRFNENNTTYMVMEFVEGDDLDKVLDSKGLLSFKATYRLLQPIIQTLGRVHKAGLIHRDISPANIKILPDGSPILLDFGAARAFGKMDDKSFSIILKPGYAPPEQYNTHGKQGSWSDVYAMCATMYRAITGITPQNSMSRLGEDLLKMPSECGAEITADEEQVLMKGLSLYADERIQSMEELDKYMSDTIEYKQTEIFTDFVNVPIINKEDGDKEKKSSGRMIKTIAFSLCAILIISLMVFVIFRKQNPDPIEPTPMGETISDQEPTQEILNTAELITGSEVILVGDTTNIKFRSNGIIYDYLEGLRYEASDNSIVQILNDDEVQQTLIKGISEGTVKIKGTRGNEYGETVITVTSFDKSSNLIMKADLNQIRLYSNDLNGVLLKVEIEGDVPAKLIANVYNSEGLDLSISGSFDNRILLLNIRDVASREKKGVLTILVSDGNEPSHVIGKLEIPVELVF